MTREKVLAGWYAGKFRFKVFNIGSDFEFRERIIYGFLASYAKNGKGASMGEIARCTGLNRTSAVYVARNKLEAAHLLEMRADGLFYALDPAGKIPSSMQWEADHFYDRYSYQWYYPVAQAGAFSESSLTPAENYLFWKLWDLAKVNIAKHLSMSGLSAMTGIHRASVSKMVDKFATKKLLEKIGAKGHRGYFAVAFLKPPVEFLESIIDRDNPEAAAYEYKDLKPISEEEFISTLSVRTNSDIIEPVETKSTNGKQVNYNVFDTGRRDNNKISEQLPTIHGISQAAPKDSFGAANLRLRNEWKSTQWEIDNTWSHAKNEEQREVLAKLILEVPDRRTLGFRIEKALQTGGVTDAS